ncbi:hypothetical protein Q8A73_012430 [Channa argus]|nr:hypothetical protein Q8A73_012430 [Channa argus]
MSQRVTGGHGLDKDGDDITADVTTEFSPRPDDMKTPRVSLLLEFYLEPIQSCDSQSLAAGSRSCQHSCTSDQGDHTSPGAPSVSSSIDGRSSCQMLSRALVQSSSRRHEDSTCLSAPRDRTSAFQIVSVHRDTSSSRCFNNTSPSSESASLNLSIIQTT